TALPGMEESSGRMELRVFGGAFLCVGRDAGGRGYFHTQSGTRIADAGGGVGAPEREPIFRIVAATEGSSGGFGAYHGAARADSVWRGVREQEGIGDCAPERAATA